MAGSKTGTWSIVQHSRKILDLFNTYGASDLRARTSVDFETCVVNLVICMTQLALTDDYLLQKDRTAPAGPEDPI